MYGSLDSRLDFAMLLEVACAQPDWQFVFVGSTNFPTKDRVKAWWSLTRLPNVHVFSPMNQEKLATYLARFDICTIPFRDLPMTRAMNFVKLYEFLAAGKPVLAADLNEVKPFAERGLVRTYRDAQDFIALAKIALKEPPDSAKLQAFAAQHTWEDRVATLEAAMAKLIPESP
jgi:O-antigen biosynthesis protein